MDSVNRSGQAALILIMIMAVLGSVSVGVASQSVENLRTQEIENTSNQSFRAAEAALELALSSGASVPSGSLGGNVNYEATYDSSGNDGFTADNVEEGDVVQVSLDGASGVTGVNIYFQSSAAVAASLLSGDSASGYSVGYYTSDPSVARRASNYFSAPLAGTTFESIYFDNKLYIPVNLAAAKTPELIRVRVLYQSSTIGIEPVGGTLGNGGKISVLAKGVAENNVVTNLSYTRSPQRVPAIFDYVLYSKGAITQ